MQKYFMAMNHINLSSPQESATSGLLTRYGVTSVSQWPNVLLIICCCIRPNCTCYGVRTRPTPSFAFYYCIPFGFVHCIRKSVFIHSRDSLAFPTLRCCFTSQWLHLCILKRTKKIFARVRSRVGLSCCAVISGANVLPPFTVGSWQRRMQGWQFGVTAPSNNCGAPLIKMRPFLVLIEVETGKIYVTDFDTAS